MCGRVVRIKIAASRTRASPRACVRIKPSPPRADAHCVRRRIVTWMTLLGCLLWSAAGLGMLVLQLLEATAPAHDVLVLLAGCVALAIALATFGQ